MSSCPRLIRLSWKVLPLSLLQDPTPSSLHYFIWTHSFPRYSQHILPLPNTVFPLLLRAVASVTNPISSLPTSSSAHSNLASVPMQITVTTVLNAPSQLQTAKSKALTSSSVCVDDANCTSFLASLLDSQTGEPTY